MRSSIWSPYVKANPCIGNIGFDSTIDALIEIGNLASVELLNEALPSPVLRHPGTP